MTDLANPQWAARGNFHVIVGSWAAAPIGIQFVFVVIALNAGSGAE